MGLNNGVSHCGPTPWNRSFTTAFTPVSCSDGAIGAIVWSPISARVTSIAGSVLSTLSRALGCYGRSPRSSSSSPASSSPAAAASRSLRHSQRAVRTSSWEPSLRLKRAGRLARCSRRHRRRSRFEWCRKRRRRPMGKSLRSRAMASFRAGCASVIAFSREPPPRQPPPPQLPPPSLHIAVRLQKVRRRQRTRAPR